MWNNEWRGSIWTDLDQEWDMIVIGGGITGAGVFRTAVSAGLKTLLVEARDFSFGTSSRSSKLVHGGFRYLSNRQYHVTYESVKERQRLLRNAPHLITPLPFNLPNYQKYNLPSRVLHLGVIIYDLMAPKWNHQVLSSNDILDRFYGLNHIGLIKGFRYQDAVLDDSRLVFRIIRETVQDGGTAINYASVDHLLRDKNGAVHGIVVRDTASDKGLTAEVKAKVIVNAAGPWTDEIRRELKNPDRLRLLRGSHLVFERARFPASEALNFFHPHDRRAMFVIPWEGATLVGTTDIDHSEKQHKLHNEPCAEQNEIEYILSAVDFLFPQLNITQTDIISSFAGLRPVINTGAATPSKESRAHQVWNEDGLITITGGKLTTFRIMAKDTLEIASASIGKQIKINSHQRMLKDLRADQCGKLEKETCNRLFGRFGGEAKELLHLAKSYELKKIGPLPTTWAEVRWAAASEGVVHLDDLLLRRTRIGLLLPEGGKAVFPRIRQLAQTELGWSDNHWEIEEARYWDIWQSFYSPTPGKFSEK
ncbi:MAG: glycerol-3-phosphate dehydrogenase/oxidase [Pelolinea sp.]|nr:glycerol-3-phosphate dehydrogenase/oxidase [Pelolinea sp.]